VPHALPISSSYLITRIIFGEEYKLWRFLLCSFLQSLPLTPKYLIQHPILGYLQPIILGLSIPCIILVKVINLIEQLNAQYSSCMIATCLAPTCFGVCTF
jgi:hypothetical protein